MIIYAHVQWFSHAALWTGSPLSDMDGQQLNMNKSCIGNIDMVHLQIILICNQATILPIYNHFTKVYEEET